MTSQKTIITNPSERITALMEKMRAYKTAQYTRLAQMRKSDFDVVISVR